MNESTSFEKKNFLHDDRSLISTNNDDLSPKEKPKHFLRNAERVLQILNQHHSDIVSDDIIDSNKDNCVTSTSKYKNIHNNDILTPQTLSDPFDKIVFRVVYGKKSTKKHKTYGEDGTLVIYEKSAILKDSEGNILSKTSIKPGSVIPGHILSVGNKEVEIVEEIASQEIVKTTSTFTKTQSPEKFKYQQFIPVNSDGNNVEHSSSSRFTLLQKKVTSTTNNLIPLSIKKNVNILRKRDISDECKQSTVFVKCNTSTTENNSSCKNEFEKVVFKVVYGKKTTRKHKTFDEDGILEVYGKSVILKDAEGKVISGTSIKPGSIIEGFACSVGNKEVEVIEKIPSPKCQLLKDNTNIKSERYTLEPPLKKMKYHTFIPVKSTGRNLHLNYEPLVMPHLNTNVDWDHENSQRREVSVDSCLASVLRPHQRSGLVFLYKCVMGMNHPDCHGAILADEMGLGKTLQCISLIWTLLKQGPLGKPVAKRVLIVAPSSLCTNWKKEIIHWLGSHRINPFIVEGKYKPRDFLKFPRSSVMIISYEMLVRNFDDVNSLNFDLLVCDEGHRLKNREVKTLKLINQLNCQKRILLTGTPVQNDLQELYTLSDFVNPGLFKDSASFKKYYENPIVESQKPDASEDAIELGQERAKELYERTQLFILRRTNELINKYLPQKHELVIFCGLTHEQRTLYESITNDWFNRSILGVTASPLTLITILKKICNHPTLLKNDKSDILQNSTVQKVLANVCSKGDAVYEHSGKIMVVRTLMRSLKLTSEKLVLVSYFTQTLDLLEKLCFRENLMCCRLDGSTLSNARMKIVEQFNSITSDNRVFLLSAKAGGVGLNLPGASRLVLFDSDWNPASDAQAMARIWREGQKRSVYLYRLLTTGTIEERQYHRQISKTGLSEAVVDSNHLASLKLSTSELKDLFTLVHDTKSITHDLLECECHKEDNKVRQEESAKFEIEEELEDYQFKLHKKDSQQHLTINQLLQWKHFTHPVAKELLDELMLEGASEYVTCVFKNSSQSEI